MTLFWPLSSSFRAVSRIATRLSSTSTEGPYKDTSVGPDGKIHVGKLIFVEEPLGLPAKERYGWPYLDFNESIGPDNCYVISRKLGWGMSSSTWLARDKMYAPPVSLTMCLPNIFRENSYVALEILNGHHTNLVEQNLVWELEVLECVSSPSSPHCLGLLSHFTFPGKRNAGQHLCLVTKVLGGDVKSLFLKRGIFPLPLAKRILLHLLRGIAHAHSRGVVHTDVEARQYLLRHTVIH
ncbi:kinase-like domain-containing protein [Armillaria nabsnona]|nr:kinase-like domain-containing protein [Armillaria nabsnona]